MNSIKNYDIVSCLLVLSLMIIGLVNIYSSTYFNEMNFFSLDNFFGKQLFFFSICILTFFLCMIPDIKIYFKYGSIIYLLMVFLLIGVLFLPTTTGTPTYIFFIPNSPLSIAAHGNTFFLSFK